MNTEYTFHLCPVPQLSELHPGQLLGPGEGGTEAGEVAGPGRGHLVQLLGRLHAGLPVAPSTPHTVLQLTSRSSCIMLCLY